jgi:hypothetical protein
LAHILLLAVAVTSGSQLDDLDYSLQDSEVVIFDSVSGGNGSCETAFEFLSEAGTFNLEKYLGSEEREELYKPRNFDETAFEFLLPCLNGVSDRIFLFGKVEPFENEIRRKLSELKGKSTTHNASITRIRTYGSSSARADRFDANRSHLFHVFTLWSSSRFSDTERTILFHAISSWSNNVAGSLRPHFIWETKLVCQGRARF